MTSTGSPYSVTIRGSGSSCAPELRQNCRAQQEIPIAVHDEAGTPPSVRDLHRRDRRLLAGVGRVVSDPGFEQVAQDVQRVGAARLGAEEVDELRA